MIFGFASRRYLSSTVPRPLFNKFYKNVVDAAPKEHIVEKLVKPIGLEAPPTSSTVYSKGNTFRDMFDNEKTEKRSQELGLEFSKSGMYEMHTFRKTGGKLFISPSSYWRSDKALYFPHLKGRNLLGAAQNLEDLLKGKTSIVRIFSSKVGDDLTKSYFENKDLDLNYLGMNYNSLMKGGMQVVEVNLIENFLKTIIMKLSLGNLRSMISQDRHSTYFMSQRAQIPYRVREQLHINNVYTGYVFIVDPNLKIRWFGCGSATTEEFKTLWKCARAVSQEKR